MEVAFAIIVWAVAAVLIAALVRDTVLRSQKNIQRETLVDGLDALNTRLAKAENDLLVLDKRVRVAEATRPRRL